MVDDPELHAPDSNIIQLYMRNLCLFYMRLQAKFLISSSTIQVIVEEINNLYGVCEQNTRQELKSFLKSNTHLSEAERVGIITAVKDVSFSVFFSSLYRARTKGVL